MARDEDEDLYEEEFDFVDDDDEEEDGANDDTEIGEEAGGGEGGEEASPGDEDERGEEEEEPVDEYGRPEQPAANYVVHIYEHRKFKRTIDRPFTPEDAEAFATEFNRTSKNYGRFALAGKNETKPKKALD